MSSQTLTYAINADDLEAVRKAVEELFGTTMELVESDIWGDYYISDESKKPIYDLRENYVFSEDDFQHPEFQDHTFILDIIGTPDPETAERLLAETDAIEAVFVERDIFDDRGIFLKTQKK